MNAWPDKFAGTLLGMAVGDAVGLPREGLTPRRAQRLFGGPPMEHRLVFGRGMLSGDTELDHVVATNDKKRFAFSDDGQRIRASQGHSVQVELALPPATPPEVLYHGTATRFLLAICQTGLQRMQRQHVHLHHDVNTAASVGTRHGKLAMLQSPGNAKP
jgi:hypothetical protein